MKRFLVQGGEEQAWGEEKGAKKPHKEEKALEIKNRNLAEHVQRMTFPQNDEARQHGQ